MWSYPVAGISDPVSSVTHFFGAIVFSVAAYWMLKRSRGCHGRTASICVFIGSAIFLLLMSGFYHLFVPGGTARTVLERLDHIGIFLLIAGTFTPSLFILHQGRRRWVYLSMIWSLTIAALVMRMFFFASISHVIGIGIYLALGWCGLFPAIHVSRVYGIDFALPLYIGALAYTIGGVLEASGQSLLIPGVFGPHEQFHFAVLFGIGAHWKFIYSFAAGAPPEMPAPQV